MTVHELSQWLLSLDTYFSRKSKSLSFKVPQRAEVIVDFGFAYGNELAYLHHAIVLKMSNDKVFVVPTSSSKDPYKKKLNPTTSNWEYSLDHTGNKIVSPSYYIGMMTDGFTKDNITVLLDDARWISRNRITQTTNNSVEPAFFDKLKKLVLERALPSIAQELESLESSKNALSVKVTNLKNELTAMAESITNKDQLILEMQDELNLLRNKQSNIS